MSAPVGNQFWKQRTKHGRDALFSDPQLLWEECCQYFENTDARKWSRKDWVGKDAMEVEREIDTPYTISGLCLFLDCDERTLLNYENNKDFFPIVTRVKKIIYTQKFEGAAVGIFNSNIIARDLGLSDKKEIEANVTGKVIKVGFTDNDESGE